jgi:hypothetical protein
MLGVEVQWQTVAEACWGVGEADPWDLIGRLEGRFCWGSVLTCLFGRFAAYSAST